MQLTRPLTTMSGAARAARRSRSSVPPLGYRVYRVRTGAVEGDAARARPTRALENEHAAARARPGDRADRAARAQGDRRRPRRARRDARGRRRRPQRHLGPRRAARTTTRSGEFECDVGAAARERAGARDRARREPLRRLDAARGLRPRRGRAVRRRARRRSTGTSSSKLLKLRYPTSRRDRRARRSRRRTAHLERPAGGDEEPGQSWVDVSGADRGLTVANDAKYGYDVARRRHRHQRRAQPGLGVARPARARGRAATSSTWTRAGRPSSCGSSRTRATGAPPASCAARPS